MKVELLSHTPDPERLVAAAAKLCYSPATIDEIRDDLTEENASKFIRMLVDLGHESPLEHISFTFGIEGVSRSLTHQLVRHRIASYSQKSQRYVTENDFEYITPPAIEDCGIALMDFEDAMDEIKRAYNGILVALKNRYMENYIYSKHPDRYERLSADILNWANTYNNLMDDIAKEFPAQAKDFEKRAAEDARYVLPNACETKIVVTMNARSLLNFFEKRCCNRAQWEIRAMADEMLALVKDVSPTIFRTAGAPCEHGPCTEGKMSCGKPRTR